MPNPYMVLDIPEAAPPEKIRAAYLNGVRRFPPERDPVRFQALAEAYELIKDEESRARLRVFGLPGLTDESRLADLAPETAKARARIGMESWLRANREAT